MPGPSPTPARPRRRFRLRFGMRTLFVLVTMVSLWLGYSMHWIRQRQEMLGHKVVVLNDPFDDGSLATAPHGLWLLGEEGYMELLVRDADLKDEVRRQFPEAKIYIPGSPWGPTLYHDPHALR